MEEDSEPATLGKESGDSGVRRFSSQIFSILRGVGERERGLGVSVGREYLHETVAGDGDGPGGIGFLWLACLGIQVSTKERTALIVVAREVCIHTFLCVLEDALQTKVGVFDRLEWQVGDERNEPREGYLLVKRKACQLNGPPRRPGIHNLTYQANEHKRPVEIRHVLMLLACL